MGARNNRGQYIPQQPSMQKHQEWLDNRNYAQHLYHLQQIRVRNGRGATAIRYQSSTKKRKPHYINSSQDKQNNHKLNSQLKNNTQLGTTTPISEGQSVCSYNPTPSRHQDINVPRKFTEDVCTKQYKELNKTSYFDSNLKQETRVDHPPVSLKQRNLLWENFLIGKRIIETPPVICKRRQDHEYLRHLQLLNSRKKKQFPSNFRQKKLRQYNENTVRIIDDIRLLTSAKKYVIVLNLSEINFDRNRAAFKDLQLNISYGSDRPDSSRNCNPGFKSYNENKDNKRQFSSHVPYSVLNTYNFYFSITLKQFKTETKAWIQIRQPKGLSFNIVGTFRLQISKNLKDQPCTATSQLYRLGKTVGKVRYAASIVKKIDLVSRQTFAKAQLI